MASRGNLSTSSFRANPTSSFTAGTGPSCSSTPTAVLSLTIVDTSSNTTLTNTTRSRRKRSVLWTHFTALEENEARCDSCGMKVLTAGNTTNMLKVKGEIKLFEHDIINNYEL